MDPTLFDPFSVQPQGYNAMPGSPTSIPEMIAMGLANKGITPGQFVQNPQGVMAAATPQEAAPPPLGASLAPSDPSAGATAAAPTAPVQSIGDRLGAALKGVKAPAAPVGTTPHPIGMPATHAVKGGNIQALLQLLGQGGAAAPTHIPLPLGQVLGR